MAVGAYRQAERDARLRRLCAGMVLLLSAQFLLGMVVNLFIMIPNAHPGAQPTNYFTGSIRSIGWAIPHGGAWLAVHMTLGLLLILCAAAVTVVAFRVGHRRRTAGASVGLAAIIGAAFNGASFLDFNQDFSSMIMAALGVVALGSYVLALY